MSEEEVDGEYDFVEEERMRGRRLQVCDIVRGVNDVIPTLENMIENSRKLSEQCSSLCSRVRLLTTVPVAHGCKKRYFGKALEKVVQDANDLLQVVNTQQASAVFPNHAAKQIAEQLRNLTVISDKLFKEADLIQSYCTNEEEDANSLLLDELCMTLNNVALEKFWTLKYKGKDQSVEHPLHIAGILRSGDTQVKAIKESGLVVRQWLELGEGDDDVTAAGHVLVNEIIRLCDQMTTKRNEMINQRTLILRKPLVEPRDVLVNLRKFDIVTGLIIRSITGRLVNACQSMVSFAFRYIHP